MTHNNMELNISSDYIFDRLVRSNRGNIRVRIHDLFAFILIKLNLIICDVYNGRKKKKDDFLNCNSHAALFITLDNDTKFLYNTGFF
ncbi:unnamed protein product [Rotaria sordida]|uniref:Uncharacterized protein n=1 Tax=Rotaria sordida TaxID=392033 RepID=A0A815V297_9BILA|nr:unnamed protein product [Rotaria sordida]CAF1242307.1 unnamed protein product [Rotaria sordida]CAF1430833.1 unnamed protein product [Rotaria sordida]CAF1524245.1 unnamed protein product [Rotaria sordida]